MSTRLRLGLFVLACATQLAAAGLGIARHERALRLGATYRFEAAPIDPVDLMRGHYVQLSFVAERSSLPLPADMQDGQAYALLGVDERGFAKVAALSATPPANGDYVRVTAYSAFRPDAEGSRLQFPFDRFYVEESKAPDLERRYREQTSSPNAKPAYAIVHVLEGLAVLDDLHFEDE